MSANRQHFLIFPNSQNDWKLRWLSVEKESSNEQGVKVEFLNEFLILSKKQISIFSSALLSKFFTISEKQILIFQKVEW